MSEPKDMRIPMSEAKESVIPDSLTVNLTHHSFSGPLVRVIISFGDEQNEVSVPLNLLRASSRYFQKATKPEWNELRGQQDMISIEAEPQVFKAYVHWLHLSTLPCPSAGKNYEDCNKDYIFLAKLYVMGEELMDTKFQNDILDTIIATSNKSCYLPIGQPVAIIYAGTPAKSPARRLMVDFCVYSAHDDNSWTKHFPNCPKEFLVEVLGAIVKLRDTPPAGTRPWKGSHMSYHEPE